VSQNCETLSISSPNIDSQFIFEARTKQNLAVLSAEQDWLSRLM